MKKKHIIILLLLAVSGIIISFTTVNMPDFFKELIIRLNVITDEDAFGTMDAKQSLLLTFFVLPLSLISYVISAISNTGNIGNAFAMIVVALICLIPLYFSLKAIKTDKIKSILLISLSIFTAISIYFYSNPEYIFALNPIGTQEFFLIYKAFFGGGIYSIIITVIVFDILKKFNENTKEALLNICELLVFIFSAYMTIITFYRDLRTLIENIDKYYKGIDIFIAVLTFAVPLTAYLLTVYILSRSIDFIDAYYSDNSEKIILKANNIGNLCIKTVYIIAGGSFLKNITQIILMDYLSNIYINITFPIISIGFCMFALIVTKLVVKNKQLQEDNDLFV